ncbi:MAG: tetratricopeptide repeat protein [Xanthomonadales bacterium]|nr:tetratricopeptide repeat protein [Xanthomonadales bacterium]MCP5473620.1 tetratricopeptide repeat protein [Rhodanobacteraceae bacterium]
MSQRLILALALCLSACAPPADERVSLALVPPTALEGELDAELAIEGLSALLLARLRALPEVQVRIDVAGCGSSEGPTHALTVSRQLTAASALTSVSLQRCDSDQVVMEQWVQPRQARREWSALAAWWVGGQLQVPRPRPAAEPAVDETDMQGFLVALARIKRRTAEDVREARASLIEVVARRPEFALAQAHLATAHLLAFEYGLLTFPQALEQADQAISAALQEAPDLGMAHAARGLYWMNQDRYDLAVPQLARAAALDPGEGAILLWLGNALLYHGSPREAQPWLERALQLDPGLVSAQISLGEAACLAGYEARCAAFLDQPGSGPMAGFMVALIRAQRGEIEQAHQLLDRVPADVNHEWVTELRVDLCGLAGADIPPCRQLGARADAPTGAKPTQPRWAQTTLPSSTDGPKSAIRLDLWRMDLGLAPWVSAARSDSEVRAQLENELGRLRQGGLSLPLIDDIEYCLAQWQQPQPRPRRTPLAAMLQAWGCAAESPLVE